MGAANDFSTHPKGGILVYNSRLPATNCFLQRVPARVVELVDAGDSKSPAARRAGSSPASGTTLVQSPARHPTATPAGTAAARPPRILGIAFRRNTLHNIAGHA